MVLIVLHARVQELQFTFDIIFVICFGRFKENFHIKGKDSFKSTSGASISILLRILMLTILIKKTIDLVTKVDYQFYEIVKR